VWLVNTEGRSESNDTQCTCVYGANFFFFKITSHVIGLTSHFLLFPYFSRDLSVKYPPKTIYNQF